MRYTGPKVKKARRLGMAFTAKDAKTLQKRAYAPGQHGQARSRVSEYGLQLREKQKMKINYGILERQFRNYFKKALGQAGVTGDNLLKFLETRLDNVVYRLGFAESRAQARQLVNHGFFTVDGQRADIPSFHVKVGSVIKFKDNKLKSQYIDALKEKLKGVKTQEWLELDRNSLSGKILTAPTPQATENVINTQQIVEHYSRT